MRQRFSWIARCAVNIFRYIPTQMHFQAYYVNYNANIIKIEKQYIDAILTAGGL